MKDWSFGEVVIVAFVIVCSLMMLFFIKANGPSINNAQMFQASSFAMPEVEFFYNPTKVSAKVESVDENNGLIAIKVAVQPCECDFESNICVEQYNSEQILLKEDKIFTNNKPLWEKMIYLLDDTKQVIVNSNVVYHGLKTIGYEGNPDNYSR